MKQFILFLILLPVTSSSLSIILHEATMLTLPNWSVINYCFPWERWQVDVFQGYWTRTSSFPCQTDIHLCHEYTRPQRVKFTCEKRNCVDGETAFPLGFTQGASTQAKWARKEDWVIIWQTPQCKYPASHLGLQAKKRIFPDLAMLPPCSRT